MNMNLVVLAKLIASTTSLLLASYILLSLTVLVLVFATQSAHADYGVLVSLILCLLHHYISIRLKFDSDLINHIVAYSRGSHGSSEPDFEVANENLLNHLTQQLDQSLLTFNLLSQDKAGRAWSDRIQGCLRLFKIQILILFIQCIFFVIACFLIV